ncbi:Protein of unknown function [Pyronema omphalodes CBS 100304]|uniref:Uncharacterized protein n=1 Tax=Pyronema omphalodes (strain CBS 100304) TaxID=1076935 RepID=U4LC35_PYROM|nr:Protein of unknown function [Pyronema omphalodes CBS 100304]
MPIHSYPVAILARNSSTGSADHIYNIYTTRPNRNADQVIN